MMRMYRFEIWSLESGVRSPESGKRRRVENSTQNSDAIHLYKTGGEASPAPLKTQNSKLSSVLP